MESGNRTAYAPEFKARVALAALEGTLTIAELSRQFGVAPERIAAWRGQLVERAAKIFDDGESEPAAQIATPGGAEGMEVFETLQHSRGLLPLIIDAVPALVAYIDADSRYCLANATHWSWLKLSPQEIIGRPVRDVLGDAAWANVSPWLTRALAGEAVSYETQLSFPVSGSRWVTASYIPDVVNGEVHGVVVLINDISERVQDETALRARERKLAAIVGYSPSALSLKTPDGRYALANPNLQRIHHRNEAEIVGKTDFDLYPDDLASAYRANDDLVLRTLARHSIEEIVPVDGQIRVYMSHIFPVLGADGQAEYICRISLDITDRKRADEEIRRLNADLEQQVAARTTELVAANRELEAFTFATSHDFKGPLGRIHSFCTLLEKRYRDRLEGDGLVFLDIIRQNTTRLAQLVEDLLGHARATQQALELQKVSVRELAQEVLRDKADDIRASGAEVTVNLPDTEVLADPYLLAQAISNLVENALKYSTGVMQPIIEIGGKRSKDHLLLWVRDNGIGFKMEYHDKIFQMFQRLHTYTEYTGSGVGLALVKRAVERMGGSIRAESAPGQGATFYLELQAVT